METATEYDKDSDVQYMPDSEDRRTNSTNKANYITKKISQNEKDLHWTCPIR